MDIYAKPGVESACLHLQNRFGADVSLLLFCCWYGSRYGSLEDDSLPRMISMSRQWAEGVVLPLRRSRSWMKRLSQGGFGQPELETVAQQTGFKNLRDDIKQLELEAERLQHHALEGLSETFPGHRTPGAGHAGSVRANMYGYLAACGISAEEASDYVSVVERAVATAK